MKEKQESFPRWSYLIIGWMEIFLIWFGIFLWYSFRESKHCTWWREVIKETTVNLNRDENKPVWTRYSLLCKDTGEIKTREDFKS